jgi:hypothetical protein
MKITKALSVALAVALAIAASSAPAAPAAEFKSAMSPVNLVGQQDPTGINKLTIEAGSVIECKKAQMKAPLLKTPAKTVLLTPDFGGPGGCNAFGYGAGSGEIAPNGCQFEFLQPNAVPEGNVAIRCPAGNAMKIYGKSAFLLGECEVTLGEAKNENIARNLYATGGGMVTKITTTFQMANMLAIKVKDNGNCALNKIGEAKAASYTGVTVFEGEGGISVSVG